MDTVSASNVSDNSIRHNCVKLSTSQSTENAMSGTAIGYPDRTGPVTANRVFSSRRKSRSHDPIPIVVHISDESTCRGLVRSNGIHVLLGLGWTPG